MNAILENLLNVMALQIRVQKMQGLIEQIKIFGYENLDNEEKEIFISFLEKSYQKALGRSKESNVIAEIKEDLEIIQAVEDFKALDLLTLAKHNMWDEYTEQLRALSGERDFDERMILLDIAHNALNGEKPFSKLSKNLRYLIAGNNVQAIKATYAVDAGLFGSMRGAGIFVGVINRSPEVLDEFFEAIPSEGLVTREVYLSLVDKFKSALEEAGVTRDLHAPLTRLLVMKRPDIFLCITGRNEHLARHVFGASREAASDYEKYWDEYIEIIQSMKWNINETSVNDDEKVIWNNRVALLDMLFYRSQDAKQLSTRLRELENAESSPPSEEECVQMMADFWRKPENKEGLPADMRQRDFILSAIKDYLRKATQKGMDVDEFLRIVFQAAAKVHKGEREEITIKWLSNKIDEHEEDH